MSDDIDEMMATARGCWHPGDSSGRIVHALCAEIDRLRIWSSDSHVTELEDEIERLRAELEGASRLLGKLGYNREEWNR